MVGNIIFRRSVTLALLLAVVTCQTACGIAPPGQGTGIGTDTGTNIETDKKTDTNADTGPDSGGEETDVVYNGQLVDFFLSSLADVYGMADRRDPEETVRKSSLTYRTDWSEKSGIGDAAIADVDGSGSEDLIVVRFDRGESADTILCIVEVYTCHGDRVDAFGGDPIRKELPLAGKASEESDTATALSVSLNEENELTISWKHARGKGTAPGQAAARGGSDRYSFENETIIKGESRNWLT